MLRKIAGACLALCLGLGMSATVHADSLVVNTNTGTVNQTTAITSSATDGADMVGMLVTAHFADSTSASAVWANTGATSGEAAGAGFTFRLSETGDTFGGDWTLTNQSAQAITRVVIDAGLGNSVFDINATTTGTLGSAAGLPFTRVSGATGLDIVATYYDAVALTGFAPAGDLFRFLEVGFSNAGAFAAGRMMVFETDTDNILFAGDITPVAAPLPAAAGAGIVLLGGIGAARRRRNAD